jgi:hypothetical protein
MGVPDLNEERTTPGIGSTSLVWLKAAAKNFGELAALSGAVALTLSYMVTLGFMMQLGPRSIWVVAFSDYLPTAIVILPFIMLAVTVAALSNAAIFFRFSTQLRGYAEGLLDDISDRPAETYSRPFFILKRDWFIAVDLLFGALSIALALLTRDLMFGALGFFSLVSSLGLLLIRKIYPSLMVPFMFACTVIAVLTFCFALGAFYANTQLKCGDRVVSLKLRSNSATGCLIWSGSRGVLIGSKDGKHIKFYTWEAFSAIDYR